jgi:hypothetical protein
MDNSVLVLALERCFNNSDCLGSLPAGITIELRVALKPYSEEVLIDALNEVSDSKQPPCIRSLIYSRVLLLL